MADFSYKIHEDYDYIIEEYGNTFIAARKLSWGTNENYKLDIRKYYNTENGERVSKGVSLSDEGAHELTKVLCETGYGYTEDVINGIKNRDDFMSSLSKCIGTENIPETDLEIKESDYFDPNSIFDESEDE